MLKNTLIDVLDDVIIITIGFVDLGVMILGLFLEKLDEKISAL
jgi:hypothetical protein